ncbi:MAG TPA: FAD-dependent oxidoreductase, partial [Propionibacteriaceae bacterium]|nr:FAD-dependent oxidoreductase [Propionibacteriaceae bacterium]
MARKIVIVGGGAGGMGAAGGVKAADPKAEVVVYTGFDDVAYSPCGIPYVHGREIENFEKLFLASKQAYVDAGIDVHYNTDVTSVDVKRKVVQVASEGEVAWDTLVLATGFNYADPGVPGGDLGGLYYVKNIREAMEWDKVLDTVKSAVVVQASPLGVEMVTALAHRGIETHLVDPSPWPMSEVADPDIMAP